MTLIRKLETDPIIFHSEKIRNIPLCNHLEQNPYLLILFYFLCILTLKTPQFISQSAAVYAACRMRHFETSPYLLNYR